MRNIIFSFLICLAIAGCINSKEAASHKVTKLVNKWDLVDTTTRKKSDTTINKVVVNTFIPQVENDSSVKATIDSLVDLLAQKCPQLLGDTTIEVPYTASDTIATMEIPITKYIKRKLYNACTLESLFDSAKYDTAGFTIVVKPKGKGLDIKLIVPVPTITNSEVKEIVWPYTDYYDSPYIRKLWAVRETIGIMAGLILLLFLIVILKR